MSSRAYRLSIKKMEEQNLVLEMKSRDHQWYLVDFSFEDEAIEYLLTNSEAIESMLAGREAKLRRSNGMESTFRFSAKKPSLPLKVLNETRH